LFAPEYDIVGSINIILNSSDLAYVEQVMWLIGNISGESSELRDFVI